MVNRGNELTSGASVQVLLGNGDGTFQPAQDLVAGSGHLSVLGVPVGDFNGDGRMDLAVTDSGTPTVVQAFLGNADGTFSTRTSAVSDSTDSLPSIRAVGDFNGDGQLDLAVFDYRFGNVFVMLGNGDGTFYRTLVSTPVGQYFAPAAAGDFNGDGKLDLALTGDCDACGVAVMLGNGDGTFQAATNYYIVGSFSSPMAVGDFNGDAKLDIVTEDSLSGMVSVLLGNGDGTFADTPVYATDYSPLSVATGDFNSDGKLDLAITTTGSCTPSCNPGSLSVLLGNGDGTFQAAVDYAVGGSPGSLAGPVVVADFNGDGVQDLAEAIIATGSYFVSVLLGNGDGTFQAAQNSGEGINGFSFLGVGDFNGDGKLDLATVAGDDVSVLQGNGDGTFGPAVIFFGAGNLPRSLAVGDFNGDGLPDLALVGPISNNVSILINNTSIEVERNEDAGDPQGKRDR